MIASIPKLQTHRPDFEGLPVFKEMQELMHPSKKANEENEEKRKKVLDRIKLNCSIFKSTNPVSWKVFEEDLRSFYNYVYTIDRRSPLDMISEKIDPGYWPIFQAYTQGQMEILESILGVLQIAVKMEESIPVKEEKSLLKIIIDKILKKK